MEHAVAPVLPVRCVVSAAQRAVGEALLKLGQDQRRVGVDGVADCEQRHAAVGYSEKGEVGAGEGGWEGDLLEGNLPEGEVVADFVGVGGVVLRWGGLARL